MITPSIQLLYNRLIEPRSPQEDERRREFILNIFLGSAILLALVALVKNQLSLIRVGVDYNAIDPYITPIVFLFLISLLLLSRVGLFRQVSYVLIVIYYSMASYTLYVWGIDAVIGLLIYALVIVMAGVLINTRFSLIVTISLVATLIGIHYLHSTGIVDADESWKIDPWRWGDTIMVSILLGIMACAAWLSNREIESSLKRARTSENKLKQERDSLEEKVEERTRELKEAQIEKTNNLYRLATFGQLAAGLFHDISSPLTAVSLSLEQLDAHSKRYKELANVRASLERALQSTRHMEEYVSLARKQLRGIGTKESFNVAHEIKQVEKMLSSRASKAGIEFRVECSDKLFLFGDPIKFHQIISNLVTNAFDAYGGGGDLENNHEVVIEAKKEQSKVVISVHDWGKGIAPEYIARIFDPFFTTKESDKGIGLGLAIVKEILEKEFNGSIMVRSSSKEGTQFVLTIPVE